MRGAPTFDTGKRKKRGEFITPPRPTGRRSNKSDKIALHSGPPVDARPLTLNAKQSTHTEKPIIMSEHFETIS